MLEWRAAAGHPQAAPATDASADSADPRWMLFSTTDLWRDGGFAYGGAMWAPRGLDREGPVLKLLFGGGLYRYKSGALGGVEVVGRQLGAAILPGWRFVRGPMTVTAFLGVEYQNHRLLPDDPAAGLRGGYLGIRPSVEIWYQPTDRTMVSFDGSVGSIGPSYNVRLALGVRSLDAFFIGPELQAFGADGNYRQIRAGLHLTALRTGPVEWSVGTGWAADTDNRQGLYGRLGVLSRR